MQKDGEFKEHVENLRHKAILHPFLKRYCEVGVREGLFSDAVSAIGRLHDTLVQAAYPEMIGRSIITVRPTTEAMERFPLDEKAVAYRYAEGVATRLSGKKNSTVDVYTNVTAEASEEWTREFLEDATWNVMDNMAEKVGRALGEEETNRVIALYAAIADEDLAGGDPIDQGSYGLRELVEVDEELWSDDECASRAKALLANLKNPAEQLTLRSTVVDYGNTPLLPGDKVHVALPNEGVDGDFRILSVEYNIDAKTQTLEILLELGREQPLLADYMFSLKSKTDSLSRYKLARV
jgi:hypothetical protein